MIFTIQSTSAWMSYGCLLVACQVSRVGSDLSRDSLFAQQIAISFRVQVGDGTVDSGVEGVHIGKRLVGEIEGFEVMPDHFDVVELGRVLGQPFDGEPMGAGGQCCRGGLADVNRAVVRGRARRVWWPRPAWDHRGDRGSPEAQ